MVASQKNMHLPVGDRSKRTATKLIVIIVAKTVLESVRIMLLLPNIYTKSA